MILNFTVNSSDAGLTNTGQSFLSARFLNFILLTLKSIRSAFLEDSSEIDPDTGYNF